jgi:hypothetical protein
VESRRVGLVPDDREISRRTGQKLWTGWKPGNRQPKSRFRKTSRTRRGGLITKKVVDGGIPKGNARRRDGKTRGERKPGGARSRRILTQYAGHRTRSGEQTPEVDGKMAGAGKPQARLPNDKRGKGRKNPEWIRSEG